ncbi:MAG: hypothetical protein RIS92_1545 [Verrucomicrobiota bacterium]|jgi:hypothetical protein
MQFRFAKPLTPALSLGERERHEAIRRLNSANLSCVFAPPAPLPKLLSGTAKELLK